MARVACTLVGESLDARGLKSPGVRCTVLSGGVGRGSVLSIQERVDICKLKCYICRVISTPQLG